jgi:hypothetical protein
MRCRRLCGAVVLASVLCPVVRAEDAKPGLPEPGAYVKYFVTLVHPGGSQRNFNATIRWLERVTENNEPCRWVEFDYEPESPDAIFNQRIVAKALVPEARLLGDANPLRGGLRGWVRQGEEAVAPLGDVYSFGTAESFVGAYFAWLPGALNGAGAKTEPRPRTVEHASGQLRCETADVGTYKTGEREPGETARTEIAVDFTMWRHAELKSGFAAAKLKWSQRTISATGEVSERNELWSHELTAVEFGTGAQTLLTNSN